MPVQMGVLRWPRQSRYPVYLLLRNIAYQKSRDLVQNIDRFARGFALSLVGGGHGDG